MRKPKNASILKEGDPTALTVGQIARRLSNRIASSLAVIAAMIFPAISLAQGQSVTVIEKGTVDLTTHQTFSKPFTVLEQMLYSLQKNADENIKYFRQEKNDFRWSEPRSEPSVRVVYDKSLQRIGIEVDAFVSSMNDPWTEACERHVKAFAEGLLILPAPNLDETILRFFFKKHLGPMVETLPVSALRPFLDAVVVSAKFYVGSLERGGTLAYLRQCLLDNKTGKMMFREHKY